MSSPLRRIRVGSLVFFDLNVLVLTFVPQPVSSLPISLASSPYRVCDPFTFDVAFGLASFVIVVGTWAWVTNRMTIVGFVTRTTRFSIRVAQQLSYYLRLITPFRVATARALDANDAARRTSTRRRGGLSYPFASTPRARYQLVGFGRAPAM